MFNYFKWPNLKLAMLVACRSNEIFKHRLQMLESSVLDRNLVGRKQACRTEFCPVFAAPNEQKAFNSSDIYQY